MTGPIVIVPAVVFLLGCGVMALGRLFEYLAGE